MRKWIIIALFSLLSVFGMCRYDIPIGYATTPTDNAEVQK